MVLHRNGGLSLGKTPCLFSFRAHSDPSKDLVGRLALNPVEDLGPSEPQNPIDYISTIPMSYPSDFHPSPISISSDNRRELVLSSGRHALPWLQASVLVAVCLALLVPKRMPEAHIARFSAAPRPPECVGEPAALLHLVAIASVPKL